MNKLTSSSNEMVDSSETCTNIITNNVLTCIERCEECLKFLNDISVVLFGEPLQNIEELNAAKAVQVPTGFFTNVIMSTKHLKNRLDNLLLEQEKMLNNIRQ